MMNEEASETNITTNCHPTENDIQWILQTVETNVVSPFEVSSVKQLFEIAPWSLIAKQKHENKAYAAFLDYPYSDHYSTVWYQSVGKYWNESSYSGVKTLFLHFLTSESDVKMFLEEILKVTFQSIPSLEWCCILTDKSKQLDVEIEELFNRDDTMASEEFQFWFVKRCSYIPEVGIRSKRSEDYLALKHVFSQMFGPFKNDNLKKLTLDFLDYGEERCPTYKYFTYDDDNTYIGIADNNTGEAIGFIYATIRRIDLELMNDHFQLEAVYGLRKKHPSDKNEISFDSEYLSGSEESSDEEDEVREIVTNIVDEVVCDFDIVTCLNDIIDEACEPAIRHHRRRKPEVTTEKKLDDVKTLMNSQDFNLKDPKYLSLLTRKNIKNFTLETLIHLVNSPDFDTTNEHHMKLVPRLGERIRNINLDRLQQIISSDIFDPSEEDFATVSLYVMSHMSESKLQLFKKSSVGSQIYDKLMYRKVLGKKSDILKTKKNKPAPKLSFKDTQVILHFTETIAQTRKSEKVNSNEREMTMRNLKYINYRNMGFISGLTIRGKYRIHRNYRIPKIKEPFRYESRQKTEVEENDIETYEKYPVLDMDKEYTLIQTIPCYNGGTNCFYVEQFAIEHEYESQSLYLIMAAFQYFPRVDYCMLLLPYGTRQVPYLRFHFSRIPARPFSAYGKELFVYHKAAFNRSCNVRTCNEEDINGVKKLIASSCLKEYLLKDLANSFVSVSKEMQAVVLLSEGHIFGIAVVKELKEVELIRRNYDVTERIDTKYHKYRSQGLLLHCVIHPIFNFFSNMFLKEIMRLCKKSILYYKIYPTHLIPYDPTVWQSLCNVLENFVPLKPVKKVSHKKSSEKSYIVLNTRESDNSGRQANTEDKYYCLCYTCTKIVLKDKHINSSRIVVIGNSSLVLGVLEKLIYRYDYKYTNVAVISKYGIRGELKLEGKCRDFLPLETYYTTSKLDNLCLPAWVTVIRGEIVSIKQNLLRLQELSGHKKKHFSVGFDFLVICNDLEFQTIYVRKSNNQNHTKKGQQYSMLKGLWQETYTLVKNASNVFTVNNVEEAATVLNWLWRYFLKKVESRKQPKKKYKSLAEMERDKKEGRIVIYGNYLEAYTAFAVLIAEKFPLSKITFVKAQETDFTAFNSKFVQEAIDYVIQRSGLEIFMDAVIEYNKGATEILHVDVTTERGTIRLDCCALLLFDEKKVNCNIFQALHRSSLSFTLPLHNSKSHPYLLINRNFQTNIANIFAAGTVTEMHTNTKNCIRFEDCAYNEREIGLMLGENLSKAANDNLDTPNVTLPTLKDPVVTYAKLPCAYFYILISDSSSDFHGANDEKSEVENHVKALVLGNLQTGLSIIPAPLTQEETDLLNEYEDSEERLEYQEFLKEMRDLDQESEEKIEEVKRERIQPDVPEYFAITFNETETIKAIKCLTSKDIDIESLKNLLGTEATNLYKILQKVQYKDSEMVYFQLMEDWILPLDYVMFNEDTIEKNRGYEGYWRPGYPKEMENRLNTFLDSFVVHKANK